MATQDPGSDQQESKTPEQIRAEIEQTREELGDTVEALGAKTDVKGRAQDKVDEVKGRAQDKVGEIRTNVQDKLPGGGPSEGAATGEPSAPQVQAQAAVEKAKANPLPVAIVAALLLGYLIGKRRRP